MAVDWSKLIYANSSTPYLDTFNKLKSSYTADADTSIANIEKERDNDLAKSNAGYDNTARQNYINYMQAQKRLPNELNSLGIRGGASESSLIRLGTNYNTNVASNESARQTAANDIRSAYAKQIDTVNSDLATRLAQAQADAEQNQLRWETEQKEKDLQYFSGAIDGLYKNKDGYKKLIAKLKASNDPNKEVKIMLATRAMNALEGSGGSGGGGGGSRRSYGGRSYGGGSSSGSVSSYGKDLADYGRSIVSGVAKGSTVRASGIGAKPKKKASTSGYRIHGEASKYWQ